MIGSVSTSPAILSETGRKTDRRPAAIPRHYWTTERWGNLLVGGLIAACLAVGCLYPACRTVTGVLVGWVALQLVATSVLGWCPFHELLKWFGIPDREEVYARLQIKEK